MTGARAAQGALVVVAALAGGLSPAHADLDDSTAEAVTVQGGDFRRIQGGPAPLYIAESLGLEPATWALTAMQSSWDQVPALMTPPLPSSEIPLFHFRDHGQFVTQSQRVGGTVPAIERDTCFARTVNPSRAIYCDVARLHNQEEAIQLIGHELTHQVIVGDLRLPRSLPSWYNEGLAEYVGSTLVGRSRPACSAWLWMQHEQRATAAIRASQYPPWRAWRAARTGAQRPTAH